jgi:hypothetical protein
MVMIFSLATGIILVLVIYRKRGVHSFKANTRKKAIENLVDQDKIAQLLLKEKMKPVIEIALDKITEQSLLLPIIMSEKTSPYAKNLALEKLENQQEIIQIAKTHRDAYIREGALAKITDQAVIANILASETCCEVCFKAIELLKNDQKEVLKKIAADDEKPLCVRGKAAERLGEYSLIRTDKSEIKTFETFAGFGSFWIQSINGKPYCDCRYHSTIIVPPGNWILAVMFHAEATTGRYGDITKSTSKLKHPIVIQIQSIADVDYEIMGKKEMFEKELKIEVEKDFRRYQKTLKSATTNSQD